MRRVEYLTVVNTENFENHSNPLHNLEALHTTAPVLACLRVSKLLDFGDLIRDF